MSGPARGAVWTAAAFLLFFAADALLFRTGWYTAWLEPDSSAGSLESRLFWLDHVPPPKVADVLVVGDSRIAEGFSSRAAASAVGGRLHFWNLGIGGTTPRVWYYALRDADPTRRRFAAIVIALDNYSDTDWWAGFEDRATDQNYLAVRLGLGDCLNFALSMHSIAMRHHAFFGCLFRGMVLRSDVQAFAADPASRIRRAGDWLAHGLAYTADYPGKPENLRGLTVDWAHRTMGFPEGLTESTRANLIRFLLPELVPNLGALARYRRLWLGRILALYRNSPARVVFLQLPRAPLMDPNASPDRAARFVDTAGREPRVTVLPAETFMGLERPELFADALHLNRDGRALFSARLARETEALLGAPAPGNAGGR